MVERAIQQELERGPNSPPVTNSAAWFVLSDQPSKNISHSGMPEEFLIVSVTGIGGSAFG